MASRYGRSQRRRDREAIVELQQSSARLRSERDCARAMLSDAERRGAEVVLRSKFMEQDVERVSDGLVHGYAPELKRVAEMVLSRQRERVALRVASIAQTMDNSIVISGVIPMLQYNIVVLG